MAAELEAEAATFAGGTRARIALVCHGEEVEPEILVQRINHVGDRKLRRIIDGGREPGPEIAQQGPPLELAV